MVTRRRLREKLTFDFTWATIDPRVGEKAAKAVAINADGPQEALFLLDMLGLVGPQEGNERKVRSQVKSKDDLARDRLRAERRRVREANKEKERIEQLAARGIQPHEVGE